MDKMHSVKEVQEMLGAAYGRSGYNKVLGLIANGELEAINVSLKPNARRKTWAISHEAIEDFKRRRSSLRDMKAMQAQRAPRRSGRASRVHQYV